MFQIPIDDATVMSEIPLVDSIDGIEDVYEIVITPHNDDNTTITVSEVFVRACAVPGNVSKHCNKSLNITGNSYRSFCYEFHKIQI